MDSLRQSICSYRIVFLISYTIPRTSESAIPMESLLFSSSWLAFIYFLFSLHCCRSGGTETVDLVVQVANIFSNCAAASQLHRTSNDEETFVNSNRESLRSATADKLSHHERRETYRTFCPFSFSFSFSSFFSFS
jgi:hypothetical protein